MRLKKRQTELGDVVERAVRRVAVDTTPLVDLEHVDLLDIPDVRGAIVRLRPTIHVGAPGERDGDAAAIMQAFRDAGAIAVQWAPRVVRETVTKAADTVAAATSDVEAAERWFGELRGVPEATRKRALELARGIVEGA